MSAFRVRELRSTDAPALLAFEIQNRAWFEAHVDARPPAFYSAQGVVEHIDGYLTYFARGVWHPFVIEDASGAIVARANLKSIDARQCCAEVGYRVGQSVCGQGLATLALRHLIREARQRWQLTQLLAYVFKDNLGSCKVLERCGFLLELEQADTDAAREYRFTRAL
ncbi:GNAT family N-acetyltransferase [Pseudomonas sp. SDI]|uniref:GNAT family N-acetyltransferase n=1 Tax=Pseudomonas sp. SDI TaxID=2170734 RepID=UPI000DE61853|nr:GNAT family N-acetyltransferase [Pseudomonas sp. SDI]PWB31396.1 GNAT family N-acetyltransferase [Pseudomonas sp. SDI]